MPTQRHVDPDIARTPAAIEELMADYLQGGGCACRFPRFRATVARETDIFGAPLMTWEQDMLIRLFDRKVKLEERRSVTTRPAGYMGRCPRCGAAIRRGSVESFRDQWIEYLSVEPRTGVAELGPPVIGALPHCWPFFAVGDAKARSDAVPARRDAEVTYPRLPLDTWLAWMRARLTAPQGTDT
jgi:hypothetical protein